MVKVYIHNFILAAQAAGIKRLKFYADEKKSRSVSVYQGDLESIDRAELIQLYIEGEYEGFSGSVFVENFDPEHIGNSIKTIQESARYGKKPFVPYSLEELPEATFGTYKPAEMCDVLDQMIRAEKICYEADSRIVPDGSFHLTEASHCYTLADEKETFATDFVAGGSVYLFAAARVGDDVQSSNQGTSFSGDKIPDMSALARAAAKEAVSLLGSGSCKTGASAVVLESRVVCELLDAFMPAFFAQSVRSRMSVLAYKLEKRIAGENVTILEDPMLETGLRCRRFDDEGVKTCKKNIVSKGILQTYLHNRETACKEQHDSTGNGFKKSFNESVSTGYTNVILQQGSCTLQDLVEEMDNGVLISGISGVFAGAHPVSGDFSLIAKGYRVENGKIGSGLKQITIAGNFFSMLENVQRIGCDERRMLMGNGCVCAPSLYIHSLMISGKEA